MPPRAVVFVDGNNWFHGLRATGVTELGRLDYAKISIKLVGPRHWSATRYYVGRVPQRGEVRLYAAQRRFLGELTATDRRISVHLGRLERRPMPNPAAEELLGYLAALPVRIDRTVFRTLQDIGRRHRSTTVLVEKAVDVMLAVDLVAMAVRGEYDAAYLLSADGDFTPAVAAARSAGRKVYAVSPSWGAELAASVDRYIRLDAAWFSDCYR